MSLENRLAFRSLIKELKNSGKRRLNVKQPSNGITSSIEIASRICGPMRVWVGSPGRDCGRRQGGNFDWNLRPLLENDGLVRLSGH